MNQLGDFFEQGIRYFLFYENLMSLTLLLALVASANLSSFSRALGTVFLFVIGIMIVLLFGSLGFSLTELPGFKWYLFGSIVLLALWNFTLRERRGFSRKSNPTPRYVFSFVLGLLHGLAAYNFFGEISADPGSQWGQAMIFWLGLLLFSLGAFIIGFFLFSLINSFFRVKPREWNLILTSVALGLALGFLL